MKKYVILLFVILFASGCTPGPENLVGPDTEGIWQAIVRFSSQTILFLSEIMGNNLVFGVIGLGILFSIILIPFTIQQQNFSNKIQKIQPEIDRINKKYEKADPKDPEVQQRKSMEIMALYQKNKLNPMSGCLPMLIQFPLLIAVYGGVTNLVYFQQNGQNGLHLYDATHLTLTLFNLDLSLPGNTPTLIWLPVLSAIISYISIQISNIGMDTSSNPSMKMMTWMSPIMSLVIGLQLPAVITVYWIVTTIVRTIVTIYFKLPKIKEMRDKKKILK